MTYTFDERTVSDLHKDAFGFRPREYFWAEWNNATADQKQVIWDDLLDALERTMEWERQQEQRSVADYLTRIQDMLSLGARDENQARKWLVQSLEPTDMDLAYGGSWVVWSLGLPYSMKEQFEEVCRELAQAYDREVEEWA